MIVGVVGKANVGKSTLFKAMTLADVEIANYPFATIKPNNGVGFVRLPCADAFFNVQCNPREGFCINHQRFVPVNLIDVAGLVPGAHEGKGLGNQFLDDLRQAHCLIHVVDAAGTTNERGEPIPAGTYDPVNDVKFLEVEMDMWYLGIFKRVWEKFSRQIYLEKQEPYKAIAKQFSGLNVTENMIKELINKMNLDQENATKWTEDQLFRFAKELRKRTKPMIIAANKVDIGVGAENFQRLKKEFPDYTIIACSAESELALKEASKHKLISYVPGDADFQPADGAKLTEPQNKGLSFIKENVLDKFGSTGVQEVLNRAVFDLLKYIAIFPGGLNKLEDQYGRTLPDCFLLPPGSTALDFAFKIHTDLGQHFIRAIDVKSKRPVGKEHMLNNLDVIEIIADR